MTTRPLQFSCAILFTLLTSSGWCYSADVVFVRSASGASAEQQEMEVAAGFYGLDLKVVTARGTHNEDLALRGVVERNETLAVAIEANALAQVNEKTLLQALARSGRLSVPLLVLGLTPETDPILFRIWSGGAAVGCARLESLHRLTYAIGSVSGLTGQLKGLDIPFPSKDAFYFALNEHKAALEIIKVGDDHQFVPVFIEATLNQQRVFLDCTIARASDSAAGANDETVASAFAKIAPAMMFIKYCAGDHGWHALHHFANLTIDDPWLREPYGFLDYKALLVQMEKHDFHTTIALIPWNYDRSDPEVVALILNHPDKFSICIHGDNHDHKEFTDYRSKPLDVQVAALRQSLARMDRFQVLTGIPYDKVMVFPHSIAPQTTLEALKTYDYLATVNSANVPMDSTRPPGLAFPLRPVTVSFGGFPSIIRYSVAAPIPEYLIAINGFLDNPLFLYCHHDFFETGMGAFDDVADRVNKLAPDTRWRGLGDIVKHFYLVKERDDSHYDVLAFSAIINLENTSGRDSVFHVRKREGDHAAIASVNVEGQTCPFQLHDGYLDFSMLIPAGHARSVSIRYENKLPLSDVSIEKKSFRVYLLRIASDFRDNTLYRNAVGRALIHSYYDGEPKPSRVLACAIVLMLSSIGAGWSMRRVIKKRHPVGQRWGSSPDLSSRSDGERATRRV